MAEWISWKALALLVAANSAPVVAAWLAGSRASWPLDFGVILGDGERVLGGHKTWRGLAAAAAAAAAAGALLGLPAGRCAIGGAAAIAGDALSSFVKRRLRLRPGAWIPGLDQLPEALLPLAVVWQVLGLDWARLTGTTLLFVVLDLVASRTLGSSRHRSA